MTISKRMITALFAAVVAAAMCLGISLSGNAQIAFADETSQQVEVKVPSADIDETFTADDLTLNKTNILGYLYKKPNGDWYTVGIQNYITLDDLFEAAGASDYWKAGSTLKITCTDGVYTKYYPTFEEARDCNLFFPNLAPASLDLSITKAAPAVLGFKYSQSIIADGMTAASSIGTNGWVDSTRLGFGLSTDTVSASGNGNMGKRMPTNITEIEIVPAA